jgi:pilus assembly protein CpaC
LGNARLLAEPNLMASNLEKATFLAGGEVPVPMVQGGMPGAQTAVNITFREYGIRLSFTPEVLNDSLVKLRVEPEVSSLDYSNSVLLSGFRVPALRTRRVESTVDVLTNRSLIISGMFNEERSQIRTGPPFLSNVPILKHLFASQQWQNNQSELLVVVTPIIVDPNKPRTIDLLTFASDSVVPARSALEARSTRTPPPR